VALQFRAFLRAGKDPPACENTREITVAHSNTNDSVAKERPSRVTYELSAGGPSTTRLHLVHDDFDGQTATYSGSVDGWPLMMSSLKSLLETGSPLATK